MGQPVGGQQVEIIGLRPVTLNLRLYGRLRADGPRNQVAHRRPCRLRRRNLPRTKLLLHQRVVMRQLLQPTPPPAIAPAIPNMTQPKRGRIGLPRVRMVHRGTPLPIRPIAIDDRRMQQADQRRPHAIKLRGLPRLLKHRSIRRLNRRVQPQLLGRWPAVLRSGRPQRSKKRIRSQIAGNLAAAAPPMPSHTTNARSPAQPRTCLHSPGGRGRGGSAWRR